MKSLSALLALTALLVTCLPASATTLRQQSQTSRQTLLSTTSTRRAPLKTEPKNEAEVYTARTPEEMDAESELESSGPLPGARGTGNRLSDRADLRAEERAEARGEERRADPQLEQANEPPAKATAPTTNTAIPVGAAAMNLGTPSTAASSAKAYDYVSPVHRDSIADRLVYIEELLVKHGRAYDYRSHTARELKSILEQLNGTLRD